MPRQRALRACAPPPHTHKHKPSSSPPPTPHTHRPLNRILVAQGVTAPQAWVSGGVALLHFGACHLCIHTLGWGYLGAAAATTGSSLLSLLLVSE